MRARIVVLLAATLVGGCGGAATVGPSGDRYLHALVAEQQKLGAAERRIPRRPQTPAALARSVGLLRGAISRLAADLARIKPPTAVAALHQQLVAIARSYGARLVSAQRAARQRQQVARATGLLVSATRAASAAFAGTVERIQGQLKKS